MKTNTFSYANCENKQGRYKKLPVADLIIPAEDEDGCGLKKDKRSQRRATALVKRIASEWDWVLCGALTVVVIAGKYYVIDGGTRLRGARMRGGIDYMPCMVFEFPEAEWQAASRAYLGINILRKRQQMCEQHNSAIKAGDPFAIAAEQIVRDAGYETSGIASKKEYVFEATAALYAIMRVDRDIAAIAFRVCGDIAKGGRIYKEFLCGVFELERRSLAQRGRTIWTDANIAKPTGLGMEMIKAAINNKRALTSTVGGGQSRVIPASGILELLNKGCRSGRIHLSFD